VTSMKIIVRKSSADQPELVNVAQGQMYEAIQNGLDDGFFQHINLKVDGVWLDIWLDEEGKNKELPVNLQVPGDYLHGPIVFTGSADRNGETLGLSDEQYEASMKLLAGNATSIEWPKFDTSFYDSVIIAE